MAEMSRASEKSHLACLLCPNKQLDWQEANFKITMINKSKKEKRTRQIHKWRISTELEIYKNNLMDILGFKNIIPEIKNSLTRFHSRMGKAESRIHEPKAWLIENIQRE